MKRRGSSDTKAHREIPDIEIIDLEASEDGTFSPDRDQHSESKNYENYKETDSGAKKRDFYFYMHIALLGAAALFFVVFVYALTHWGHFVSQEEIFQDGEGDDDREIFDLIVPVVGEDGEILPLDHDGNGLTILALGNAPFADDAGSEDSLASMIEDLSGGTVINCAATGSYMAATPDDVPMDSFTPYWLSFLAMNNDVNQKYEEYLETSRDQLPPEAEFIYHTLSNIDLNDVDVVTLMYDASDYLMGHPMYSDENATDIEQFTGNMEAAIELLLSNYPHLRIIVLSPTYAFAVDENGEYISSDIQRYGWDVLSTYVIRQCYSCNTRGVTFVDNLYGTITEDNARQYLTDNLHLNTEGRRLVAERFLYALTYYGS